jgi:ubiquinone/menaquinone biosynthesis C-methylase UbiE
MVYAVDILESALDSVRGKAKFFSLLNIETIRGNLEKDKGSGLKDACCDMVILANVLFQSPNKPAILKEAKRVLRKSGKAVIIEWKEDAPFGPQTRYRVGKEDLKSMAKEAGFVLEKEFPAGSSHYGLVFSL